MNVSQSVAKAYADESTHKNLYISFPELNLTLDKSQIHLESMSLTEAILDNENLSFVGCISSQFKVVVSGVTKEIKGTTIKAWITTDDTEGEPVLLFEGIVESAVLQGNRRKKEITAYDVLYTAGDEDVAEWWNGLVFPMTIKEIRNSLFSHLGLEHNIAQSDASLVNDGIKVENIVVTDEETGEEVVKRPYEPEELKALDVLKAICQINGVFGIINRYGLFEYRELCAASSTTSGAYPGATLIPPFYPGVVGVIEEADSHYFSHYRSVDWEEFKVKPIKRVVVRQNNKGKGGSYPETGKNKYVVQGNMFTIGFEKEKLAKIAENIYSKVSGHSYYPYTSQNTGLPYVECGKDKASFYVYDYEASAAQGKDVFKLCEFYIFKRVLKGIEALKDSYSAKGIENQRRFVTDLNVRSDMLDERQDETDRKVKELEEKMDNSLKIVSVEQLPTNPDENTVYLIKGTVVVT